MSEEIFFAVRGCKFLRELHFFPQTDVGAEPTLMPKVISYLLKHLTQLQVRCLLFFHVEACVAHFLTRFKFWLIERGQTNFSIKKLELL